jgi:hypothetical protein
MTTFRMTYHAVRYGTEMPVGSYQVMVLGKNGDNPEAPCGSLTIPAGEWADFQKAFPTIPLSET